MDNSLFHGFKERNHMSRQAYYRIVIPHLLDKSIKKALYLDCDIIVKEDIRKLWNINIFWQRSRRLFRELTMFLIVSCNDRRIRMALIFV
ncbi:glycosyltransferase [Paenibacillus sp. GP183]|uniref:glycosyltransferase n=1 Tax=Paenibacillus sp. GP183 TaxID=1882751 RepID=UPI00344CD258